MKNLVSETISKFALDATAFYQGFHLHSNSTCITTGLVFEEISHIQKMLSVLETLILNERIRILEPSEESLKMIKSSITQIGETRLSDADISIIALAKEFNVPLVTDDFAICNLAKTLSIELLNLGTKGIKDSRKWVKFCKSCGRGYPPAQTVCSLCGNKLRIRFKKLIGSTTVKINDEQ
ncbi:MAG TPA: PIN domain-containing protein [Nitrososphaeraceae archaeon]|nr:PIN domain-containing protein [Nitrososphaeraceae archaeon]